MISVIIPKYEDNLYLIRCLNAIKRQTYTDVEILVVDGECEQDIIDKYNLKLVETEEDDECGGLNRAIAQSEGEYIYFCNVSTVLAPNALSLLLSENSEMCTFANVQVMAGKNFKEGNMLLSCCDKLFDKARLEQYGIYFEGNNVFSESFFVIKYICSFEETRKSEDAYIYCTDTASVCNSTDIVIDVQHWASLLQAVKNATVEFYETFRTAIMQIIKKCMFCDGALANLVEEEFHDDYEFVYTFLAPVLKATWHEIAENKDDESLNEFRSYLHAYENESFLQILLKACGLKQEHYDFIMNNTAKQCLFLIAENERLQNVDSELTSVVREIWNNPTFGLTKIGSTWYYYSNGKLDKTYRGLAKNQYGWFYVNNGVIDKKYKGLCQNAYGLWYVSNGTIDKKYTGLAMNDNGLWMYVRNGKVDTEYTGVVEVKGVAKYISNGVIDKEYTGLYKNAKGKWVYIENGTINKNFIGLAPNEYGWWYVENGTINLSFNGFAKNNLGWCEVKNGKVVSEKGTDIIEIIGEQAGLQDASVNVQSATSEDPVAQSVAYYSDGRLGFGTILKSIGAWGKYKFKR